MKDRLPPRTPSEEEVRRLAALAEYEVLDTPSERSFDDLTRLTSFICDTPIALVSLLDLHRQWFKSKVGLQVGETPIEHSFCRHAIRQGGAFIVPDSHADERFADNPLVTENPHIRFYAGVPLVTPQGTKVGTLCAIDQKPRELSQEQLEALQALARQVVEMLEQRKTLRTLRITLAEKEAAQAEVKTLQELLPMCAWCGRIRDEDAYWSNVEDYLKSRPDIRISHSVCPQCAEKVQEEI